MLLKIQIILKKKTTNIKQLNKSETHKNKKKKKKKAIYTVAFPLVFCNLPV